MTLLLALSNERLSVLVADRRVTTNGQVKDDEFNKVLVLFCDDARVALAFTGLAYCQGFNTQTWLREALYDIGKTRHDIHGVLQELEIRATSVFLLPPISNLSAADRRLAILVTGFAYGDGSPSNIVYSLSNFQTPDTGFKVGIFPRRTFFVEVAGCLSSLSDPHRESLEKILQFGATGDSIERKAVRVVQKLAAANGLIGRQCNGAIVLNDVDTLVTSTYHSADVTNRAYGADVVFALSSAPWVVSGTEIMASNVLAGPPIRNNQACWCGSGERFKHCHKKKLGNVYAKLPIFRAPLPLTCLQILPDDVTSLASGRRFVVSSGFR